VFTWCRSFRRIGALGRELTSGRETKAADLALALALPVVQVVCAWGMIPRGWAATAGVVALLLIPAAVCAQSGGVFLCEQYFRIRRYRGDA